MKTSRCLLWALRVSGFAALTAASGGCVYNLFGLIPAAEEIPLELSVVLDNADEYCGDPNEVMEMPEGTEAVSDLAALDGCWGACWPAAADAPGATYHVSQALRFDSSNGRLERFIHHSILAIPAFADVQIGELTLDEAGAARFIVTQILSTTRTGSLTDISAAWTVLPVYEVRLAMDGEGLVASFDEIDTPRTSGGFADEVFLSHIRFECP